MLMPVRKSRLPGRTVRYQTGRIRWKSVCTQRTYRISRPDLKSVKVTTLVFMTVVIMVITAIEAVLVTQE